MSLEFSITVQDGVSVVSLKGRIISDSDIEHLSNEVFINNSTNGVNWVYNLADLTHINSTGINFIIRSLTRSRVNQGDLVLATVTGNVKTLFEIAKIHEILSIYSSVSEAIKHFNNK